MAQLPPKIPAFPSHQRMPPLTTLTPPSSSGAGAPPLWMDEFLDFTSTRRGSHRRSMSDSVTFLETPHLAVEHCRNTSLHAGGFDRFDDEQLMSMFSDEIPGAIPGTVGQEEASSPSDQNSNNDDKDMTSIDDRDVTNFDSCGLQLMKSEPGEVESGCNSDSNANNNVSPPTNSDNAGAFSGGSDSLDPKRVKRILANRQSAQRSRVRKLQYISELERSVTSLQTEVSALSPRVAFLDHQRLILNVDNSALKQRIAALAQDRIFKDAHQEALKKEIERLRQIYHHQQQQEQQNMKNKMSNTTNSTPTPSSDHNMGCADKEQLMT